MVYREKMALAIKYNGKILRENAEAVQLPFSSEYSVLIKNLHTRKASVKVFIDGEDVLDGSSLIVNPNDSVDLQRFIKDNDLEKGRKFRFIEKTEEISEYRGDGIDDGLVRIEYRFEKTIQINDYWNQPGIFTDSFGTGNPKWNRDTITSKSITGNNNSSILRSFTNTVDGASYDANAVASSVVNNVNDAGITVKGSESNQEFREGQIGILETESHSLVLHIKGYSSKGEEVKKPVLVKTKKTCPSCGSKYNSKFEYCAKDGTYLG